MRRRLEGSVVFTGLVLLTACSSATAGVEASCAPSPYRNSPPLVIAHAGGNEMAPSNTMYALHRGMEAGADVLDLDLRMTADGVVVARHDRELSTTTNGAGPVDEATWQDVSALDATARWSGAPLTDEVTVASVEEALLAFPDVHFSLEIKQTEPSLADELCGILDRTGSRDRVFISSNFDEATYGFRDACPGVTITTTFRDLHERNRAVAAGEHWCWASPIGQPPFTRDRFASAEFLADAHRHGGAVFTWTVNAADDLRMLAEAGVDGVYTDRPALAREIFDDVASG
ncbi:MAG: hypothetical protein HKN44_03260 [Ilumatobacter sp.]|nr:hypothetical protein [Ilumatobacter sp.]